MQCKLQSPEMCNRVYAPPNDQKQMVFCSFTALTSGSSFVWKCTKSFQTHLDYLFVFEDHLDTVMHYRSYCCRQGTTTFMIMIMITWGHNHETS